ncbi:hypothetical protein [Vulgatibacter sp.]|uniref:hypothetical protein n=1 Tax=Vulgatibacter sp. TaxID=1971226 RepID=UPI00356417CC
MAIASLDELAAALPRGQSLPFRKAAVGHLAYGMTDLFLVAGVPGAGSMAGVTLDGEFPSSATAGALPLRDPVAGDDVQIGRLTATCSEAGAVVIYDRIWHNRIAAFDTAEKVIAWPAGTQRYSDGEGVELYAVITEELADTSPATWTVDFTDQDGATATATAAFDTSGTVGRMIPFELPPGSSGVRSVQSFQSSVAQASGALALVLVRQLADLPVAIAGQRVAQDGIALGLPLVMPGACLCFAAAHGADTSSGMLMLAKALGIQPDDLVDNAGAAIGLIAGRVNLIQG